MALELASLGRTHRSAEDYHVTRELIAEFADAVGETSAACRDPESAARLGHPAVIAPTTFVATVALRAERPLLEDPGLGLDLGRVRHRELRISSRRPVRAGDLLRCAVTIQEIERGAGTDILVTRTEVTALGEPIAEVWSTIVVVSA